MKENLQEYLKSKNLKFTKNRKIILEYINEKKEPFTAEDIYRTLLHDHPINLSTIYRTLNIFLENNILQKTAEIDGVLYFQKMEKKHQHQLICSNCKSVIPIENCPLSEWKESLEKSTGYEITSHHLEFRGLCPKCKKKK